jgi:hypothetical protein
LAAGAVGLGLVVIAWTLALRPAPASTRPDALDSAGAGQAGGPTPPLTRNVTPRPLPSPAAASAALAVDMTATPTWRDVLGAWHGQALATVRNQGDGPFALDPTRSRYTVLDGGGNEIAAGAFEAALPPVLQPGAEGYLVGGFTLIGPPGAGITLNVTATVAARAPVALRVADVRVAYDGADVVATGTVRNMGDDTVTSGAVGVVLLDGAGRPLAAVLDVASAGRLDRGERATFRATDPPTPPIDVNRVSRRVAVAWGVPAP